MKTLTAHAKAAIVIGLSIAMLAPSLGCSSAQVEAEKRTKKAGFHHKLALGYLTSKRVDLAIRELIQAFEQDDDHAKSRYLFGFVLFGRKRFEEAAANFRRAIKRDKHFFAARNHLGVTYLQMERWAEAVVALEPLLKEPTYTTPYLVHNNLGWAYLKQANLRMAGKHLRMATFINPKFCQGHRNLGLLAVEQRDLTAAVGHFEEAIEKCPKIAEFHFQLGEVLSASHHTNRAQAAFRTCKKLAGRSHLGTRCAARVIPPRSARADGRPHLVTSADGAHGHNTP
jgi:type IV pilus assembly protein PilF